MVVLPATENIRELFSVDIGTSFKTYLSRCTFKCSIVDNHYCVKTVECAIFPTKGLA